MTARMHLRCLLTLQLKVLLLIVQGLRRVLSRLVSCLFCGFVLSDADFDRNFRIKHPLPMLSRYGWVCCLAVPSSACLPGAAVAGTALSSALRERYLRGLTSYNILKNPRFKQAFAITQSFADR